MDFLEIGWGGVDWVGIAQDKDNWRALVNAVMNLWFPCNAGKLSSSYIIGGLSSSSQFHRVSYICMHTRTHIPVHTHYVRIHMYRMFQKALYNGVPNVAL
jgi:hypothetical protein